MLLESQGFKVNSMYIQALCRDFGVRISAERGIDKQLYIIPINKISDRWLVRYFNHKADVLRQTRETKVLPPICSARERWKDRKCLDYCDVANQCPYGARLRSARGRAS
ncbi:MAG: hypothetical protein MSA77_01055 [Selenomonadales bacterium]|nr:hypothetical protein [Selenomonadales bacterium]